MSKLETLFPLAVGSFSSWGPGEPSGDGGCVGFSDEHSLFWDDFPCDNYTSSGLFVGFLCEQLLNGNLTTTTTQDPGTTTATTGVTTTSEPSTTTVPSTTDALGLRFPTVALRLQVFGFEIYSETEKAGRQMLYHLKNVQKPNLKSSKKDTQQTNPSTKDQSKSTRQRANRTFQIARRRSRTSEPGASVYTRLRQISRQLRPPVSRRTPTWPTSRHPRNRRPSRTT